VIVVGSPSDPTGKMKNSASPGHHLEPSDLAFAIWRCSGLAGAAGE